MASSEPRSGASASRPLVGWWDSAMPPPSGWRDFDSAEFSQKNRLTRVASELRSRERNAMNWIGCAEAKNARRRLPTGAFSQSGFSQYVEGLAPSSTHGINVPFVCPAVAHYSIKFLRIIIFTK